MNTGVSVTCTVGILGLITVVCSLVVYSYFSAWVVSCPWTYWSNISHANAIATHSFQFVVALAVVTPQQKLCALLSFFVTLIPQIHLTDITLSGCLLVHISGWAIWSPSSWYTWWLCCSKHVNTAFLSSSCFRGSHTFKIFGEENVSLSFLGTYELI